MIRRLYDKLAKYSIMAKVINILGNDTPGSQRQRWR
jgi:hypothetical protein